MAIYTHAFEHRRGRDLADGVDIDARAVMNHYGSFKTSYEMVKLIRDGEFKPGEPGYIHWTNVRARVREWWKAASDKRTNKDRKNMSGRVTKAQLARERRQQRAALDIAKLQEAVNAYAHGKRLLPGKKFGHLTVTVVGDHTVQYVTKDGWSGAVQVPFVNARGESTPHHRGLLKKYGY